MSPELSRVAERARREPDGQFHQGKIILFPRKLHKHSLQDAMVEEGVELFGGEARFQACVVFKNRDSVEATYSCTAIR